jgi:hypothetical protein
MPTLISGRHVSLLINKYKYSKLKKYYYLFVIYKKKIKKKEEEEEK